MKNTTIKRFGYGFSALVLGLAAVNFFPVAGAYANVNYDLCSEEDTSPCFVNVTAPDSLEYTIGGDALAFSGSFNGNLIVQLDGETYTGDMLEMNATSHEFTFNFETEEAGDHTVRFLIVEALDDATNTQSDVTFNVTAVASVEPRFEFVSKVVNVNESFTVEAAKNGSVIAYDITNGGFYAMAAGDGEEQNGPTLATEEQVTINEITPGEYNIMFLKAGQYTIMIQGNESVNGVLTNRITEVMALAVGATTEAATTITDVLNNWTEANKIAEEAWNNYWKVADDPNSTEAEINAAYEEFRNKDEEAFGNAELKEVNAFGDDSEAIREAAYSGKTISTEVKTIELAEADVNATVKDALLEKLDVTFASNVKYYNVDVNVYADGELIGTLKELTGKQAVVVSGYEAAPAGYKRVYKVLGYHTYVDKNGEEQVEVVEIDDVEFDETTGSIIFPADKFSTYLVAYKDVFAPSVNAGAATDTEGASATASVSLSMVVVVTIIALAGVAKFVKVRK